MVHKIDKPYTGKCPITNDLHTIDVHYLSTSSFEGNVYQKQSFSCNNLKCERFINKTCPIFKQIPFTSIQ